MEAPRRAWMRAVRFLSPGAALAAAALGGAVLWFVRLRLFASSLPAHDVYAYYFPNMLYAARRIREGGGGLLWTPLQNCGEPFLANAVAGLFYPPNWLFAVLAPDRALVAVILCNALIAALGSLALFRQLGTGSVAALAGALVFTFGPTTVLMTTWSPIHLASYCWLPVALCAAARLLERPTFARAVALGAVLTAALLPGYPQVTLFICAAIALQVLVALPAARDRVRIVALFAAAAALPLLLGAVALLPFAEFWQQSIRSRPLSPGEMEAGRNTAQRHIELLLLSNGRLYIAAALGVLALAQRRLRRHALFFFLAGALSGGLAMGSQGPFGFLFQLPGMTFFRTPERFLWLDDLCCAGLVALGLAAVSDALASLGAAPRPALPRRQALVLLLAALVAAPVTWAMLRWERVLSGMLASSAPLYKHAATFADLRARMTPMDRAYLAHPQPFETNFAFVHKSASIFAFPALFDYEAMTVRRYAEYFVMMRSGLPMRNLNSFLLGHYLVGWFPNSFRWPMLNLAAGRYLVVDARSPQPAARDGLEPLQSDAADLRLYENRAALPRAFFVGGVEVVADPARLLARLAAGETPLDRVALVEAPPPSGFLGSADPAPGVGAGGVAIAVDRAEELVLEVAAPRRGFVFLSDTYYPGWRAEVNGRAAPILRANYAFRLVEVPAGESRVRFRFVPTSLIVGAAITLATLLALAARLLRAARRTGE